MKKFLATLMAMAMVISLVACGKPSGSEGDNQGSESQTSQQSQTNQNNVSSTGDSTGDAKAVESALSYAYGEDDIVNIQIKTSAEIFIGSGWLGICPIGIYLTESAADDADYYYEYFNTEYDKEWFDGIYTYSFHMDQIEPGTYTMVLNDNDDYGDVVGEWLFTKSEDNKVSFDFKDSWLKGAGEGRNPEDCDTISEEVSNWFSINELDSDWVEFLFDGYYLETPVDEDNQYSLMICPVGDYASIEDAWNACEEANLEMSGIWDKCPYKFSFDHSGIDKGKYTMVFGKRHEDVEIQFEAEKKTDTDWEFDFTNVKCPALESSY